MPRPPQARRSSSEANDKLDHEYAGTTAGETGIVEYHSVLVVV